MDKNNENDMESEDDNSNDGRCDEDGGNSGDEDGETSGDDGNDVDDDNNDEDDSEGEGNIDGDVEDDTSSDDDENINNDDRKSDNDNQSENNANSDIEGSSEYDSIDIHASSSDGSILDNVDDIIVTRVYASASARNIVKHHGQIFARSESDTNINDYVNKKVKKRPNKKLRQDSEWQIPSTDREKRIRRWLYFHSEIDIEEDADTDMLADGDLLFEDGPDNHVTAENGDMGNWDVYIG